jgi:hypothetical protein
MPAVIQENLPDNALLKTFRGGARPEEWGHYGDCFSLMIPQKANLEQFVFAFYTSPVFRLERCILGLFAHSPSTDADARAIANGSASRFALWYVGERTASQLLMCDRFERTRSWFRVMTVGGEGAVLQFGSAVAARTDRSGHRRMGGAFGFLKGFHVLYSRVLLNSAWRQMRRR